MNSTTRMTHIVLPGMLERKRGSIINVSSAAARNPSPLLAEYAGSKGFVEHFSESMYHELKGKGIHVQVMTDVRRLVCSGCFTVAGIQWAWTWV